MKKSHTLPKEEKELEEYWQEVQAFYARHKRMPSYQEAADCFGVRSKDTAYRIVSKMIDEKLLRRDTVGKLIPYHLTPTPLKVLGLVEAGFPSPSDEQLLDTLSLDEWLIPERESAFMLRVKGDSMYDAGIREGDMVIAERTNDPKVGAIVIAEVDGAWTMKYLRKDKKGLYLEPANERYPNIRPETSLNIAAVVKGVVRKYGSK